MSYVNVDGSDRFMSPKRAQQLLDIARRIDRDYTIARHNGSLQGIEPASFRELAEWLDKGLPITDPGEVKSLRDPRCLTEPSGQKP